MNQIFRRWAPPEFGALSFVISGHAIAQGGMAILGTRIVYSAEKEQTTIKVKNGSDTDSFLVQSWVEDAQKKKSHDFIVTPPLYLSGPGNMNALRINYIGRGLPTDKESLFYFVEKGVPSVDRQKVEQRNAVILAAANVIKMFYRPSGLASDRLDAPEKLVFSRKGGHVTVNNPTPYYATAGLGINLGAWGAFSADVTQACSVLPDDSHHTGQSLRFQYARALQTTGTAFHLAGYRYSTRGYHTFSDTALRRMEGWLSDEQQVDEEGRPIERPDSDRFNLNRTPQGRLTASISQSLTESASLYLNATRQTYWGHYGHSRSLSAGINGGIGPVR